MKKRILLPKITENLFAPLSVNISQKILGGDYVPRVGDTTYEGAGMDRVTMVHSNGTYTTVKIPGNWA